MFLLLRTNQLHYVMFQAILTEFTLVEVNWLIARDAVFCTGQEEMA